MTTRDSGCRSCWFSRRGAGGLSRRPQVAFLHFFESLAVVGGRFHSPARLVPWANSGRFRKGFVPITCLAVLDLGLPEGRSLGPTLGGWEGPWAWLSTSSLCWSRVHDPGCPSEPKWTPSRRRAKGRLAQIGSTRVVFFSLAFGRVVLGEGNDVAQLRIGVGLGGALLPPHGRRRAPLLEPGTLVKLRPGAIMVLSR